MLEVLLQLSDAVGMKNYVFWGMGSFNRVNFYALGGLALISVVGFGFMKRYASWLNVYALGDAELKLLTKKSVSFNKRLLLLVFGVWIGLITSFVGPIAFVGIVVPNILKLFFKTSNVNKLLPMTVLFGAVLVLLADLIARGALGGFILPLNAVLSVLGVPVIVYFLIKRISGVRS